MLHADGHNSPTIWGGFICFCAYVLLHSSVDTYRAVCPVDNLHFVQLEIDIIEAALSKCSSHCCCLHPTAGPPRLPRVPFFDRYDYASTHTHIQLYPRYTGDNSDGRLKVYTILWRALSRPGEIIWLISVSLANLPLSLVDRFQEGCFQCSRGLIPAALLKIYNR